MNTSTPSPYFKDPKEAFKMALMAHLELLHLPHTRSHGKQPCNKECHLLEREHMINLIKQFVQEN